VVERPCPGFIAELLAHPVYSLASKINAEYFRGRGASSCSIDPSAALACVTRQHQCAATACCGVQRWFERAAGAEADLLWKRTRCETCAETCNLRDVAEAFPRIEELHTDMRFYAARAQARCLVSRVSSICAVSCDWQ
jgi:hypothetical protein